MGALNRSLRVVQAAPASHFDRSAGCLREIHSERLTGHCFLHPRAKRGGSCPTTDPEITEKLLRCPEWRVSPYAGFGFGAFLHDGTITSTVTTSTVTIENPLPPGLPGRIFPVVPLDVPSIELPPTIDSSTESFRTPYEDSRFAYQIMAGLSAEVSKLVEFRFGYRFRSSRGEPIDADQIEAGIRFRF